MPKMFKMIVGFVLTAVVMTACDQPEPVKRVSLHSAGSLTEDLPVVAQPTEQPLNFGFDLRLGPKEDVRIYASLLKYLEGKTNRQFLIRFTKRYEDTADNLANGVIQLAALGPVNCARASESKNVGCLVMGLNEQDRPEYRSAIVTRVGSSVSSLQDLRGRSFAFGDRLSTQGYLLPRRMLESAGIDLADLGEYVFTGSHAETARLVINGRYDAGGLQDTLAKRLAADKKVRILAFSRPFPSSFICYNKKIDPETVDVVRSALLELDPLGRDAGRLVDWDRTEMPHGFIEADPRALAEIREMARAYELLLP